MGEELEIRVVDERPYWETINCKDIESIVLGNIDTQERAAQTIVNSIVTAGYYLRRQRDEKMYLEQGYDRFEDYVKDRYGKSLSWASRQMDINEAFSIGGNDPRTDEKWLDFGKSQLQEMLYLTDEQREKVTPGMTVKEIREIRKPEPLPEPDPVEVICEEVELEPEIVYEPVMADETPAETVIVESSVEEMLPEVEEEDDEEILCDTCVNASSLTGNPDLCPTCTSEGKNYKARCITGQSGSGFCGAAAYCSKPYTCCAQCSDDCNGRCGWLDKQPEKVEPVVEEVATSQELAVELVTEDCPCAGELDECAVLSNECCNPDDTCLCCADCMEPLCKIRCKYAKVPDGVELYEAEDDKERDAVNHEECCEVEITPQKVLQDEKEKLDQWMAAFEGETDVPEFITRQKIIVGALAGMVCDLEETEYVEPEQPELPIMRNNDQRKEFLDDYRSWPVWFRVPQADEIYYRYDFDDGTAFVIRETKYFNEWRIKYNEDPESVHTQEYILKPDYHYLSNCRSNRSEMIEYLRSMQKGVSNGKT